MAGKGGEDDNLREELRSLGFSPGPVTDTTRQVLVRKLRRLSLDKTDQRKDRVSAVSEVTKPSSQPHDEYSKNKDIFLSYSREDNDFVKKLKRDLESHGYSVWIDTDDIHTGADWHSVIGTALQNSKALIAVLTAKYLVSKYCKNELFMASHQKKPIFPIMLETVDFSSKDGAGVLLAVSSLNWTSFTGNDSKSSYSKSFTKLLEGLKHEGVLPSSKDKPH